ncbi:hypothetical protein T484DRAFT_1789155 [Baffinella frigidus]|nr:hypothetical protein T484DRAFT_1789155 [Cryptophyta sp. CCMP2293]
MRALRVVAMLLLCVSVATRMTPNPWARNPGVPKGIRIRRDVSRKEQQEWFFHLEGPVHETVRQKLASALEVDSLKYVPYNTYIGFANAAAVARARAAIPEVVWVGPVEAHHKVSHELFPALLGNAAARGQVEVAVLLASPESWRPAAAPGADADHSEGEAHEEGIFTVDPRSFNEEDRGASEAWWAEALGVGRAHATSGRRARGTEGGGAWVRAASPWRLVVGVGVEGAPALISKLAAHARVAWVERREAPVVRNKWAKGIVQSGVAGDHVIFDKGLKGQGEIVGIADTGIDMSL